MNDGKKKLKLGKYSFLAWFRGNDFVWIKSDDNYKTVAKQFPYIKKVDEYRYARLIENIKDKELNFLMPESIIDGIYFGNKIKEIYSKLYPHLKSYDMDKLIHNEDGSFNYSNYLNILPKETKRIMDEEDNWIMFEGLFELPIDEENKFSMKPDVLIKENGVLKLIEAKAVTGPKLEHAYDLVYQWNLMKEIGYIIDLKNVKLVTLNRNYNKKDEWDNENLWKEWDIHFGKSLPSKDRIEDARFDRISDTIKEVNKQFDFMDILRQIIIIQKEDWSKIDDIESNTNKWERNWRYFSKDDYEDFFLQVLGATEDSPFGISGLTPKWSTKVELWNSGIKKMVDMDPEFLFPKQVKGIWETQKHLSWENQSIIKERRPAAYIQWLSKKYGVTFEFKDKILKEIKKYKAPIYMFDFETVKFGVPEMEEVSPYEQIPYQYSIHIITNEKDFDFETGKNIIHKEWLVKDKDELGEKFWKQFLIDMNSEGYGTWVSYNKSFENMVIKNNMVKSFVDEEMRKQMNVILCETIDLMEIFSKKYYYHPDFNGSYSIKKVGPHFAKNKLNYEDLDYIKKGDITSREAKIWLMNYDNKEYRERYLNLRPAMLKYCEYDTLSMIAILQGIKEKYK